VIHLRRSQAEQKNPLASAAGTSNPSFRILFWCVAIALGFLQVWAHRNDLNPDGISYIEIGEAARRAGLPALLNGYWSPLYPFLISLALRLFHPAVEWEFTVVHLVNFALYLANLACFEVFLNELLLARDSSRVSGDEYLPVASRTLWIWGYLFFFWASRYWLGPAMVAPDLCVAALAYLATAALLRMYRGKTNWTTFAALGAVLGAAYLAKAAMFPLAFVFLASAFLLVRPLRRAIPRTLLALAVFLVVAAPLVFALSRMKSRATFGESGRINYAEYVNAAPQWIHWQGLPPGTGKPVHPTRKVMYDPPLFEFSTPAGGSYPPWYDPSYWYEGIQPHFSLKGELVALYRTASSYLRMFSVAGTLYAVLIALFLLVKMSGARMRRATRQWPVWLPAYAALGMYALVHVETRFVSGFGLMLLMWLFSRLCVSQKVGEMLWRRVVFVTIVAPVLAMAWPVARDVADTLARKPYEHWQVALGLQEMGILPGSKVGYIGTGLDAYWAHLADVRIIAEIPDNGQANFLAADAAKKQHILHKFGEVGATVVVTKIPAVASSMEGWRQIRGTHYYAHEIPRADASRE
jgi:4-amino-4-deoxy-L-arabinose transferase-like glycosyltransferase